MQQENIYQPAKDLQDYEGEFLLLVHRLHRPPLNDPMLSGSEFQTLLVTLPRIKTPAQRYEGHPDLFEEEMRIAPAKIARLNRLAAAANAAPNALTLKQVINEVGRLLRGRDCTPVFPGPEFNPELLVLPEA